MLHAFHSTALMSRSREHLMTIKYNIFHKIIPEYGSFKTSMISNLNYFFFNITNLCNVMFNFSRQKEILLKLHSAKSDTFFLCPFETTQYRLH